MKTLLRSWWTRRQSRLLLLAFLGAFLIGIALLLVDTHLTKAAPTCTINWTGGGGTTSWFTAANWDENRLPTTSDNVCIPATKPGNHGHLQPRKSEHSDPQLAEPASTCSLHGRSSRFTQYTEIVDHQQQPDLERREARGRREPGGERSDELVRGDTRVARGR